VSVNPAHTASAHLLGKGAHEGAQLDHILQEGLEHRLSQLLHGLQATDGGGQWRGGQGWVSEWVGGRVGG